MKKFIIAVILTIVSFHITQAQRMLSGQKGLEIGGGLLSKSIKRDYFYNITLSVHTKGGSYWIWRAEYNHQFSDYRGWQIPLETYTGEIGYSIKLLSNPRKNLALNGGLTAVAGYEMINKGDSLLFDGAKILSQDNFIYGAGFDLSLETYISDRIVFLLHGRSKLIWGTDLKLFRPSAGIGLRFNF